MYFSRVKCSFDRMKNRTACSSVPAYLPAILFLGIGFVLLFRLFRLSVHSASGFEVYWYAIHAWLAGQSPYAQYSPVYQGLVFKYPPWILPLFLPFAWISLEVSKWIWTLAQFLCIFYSMAWLRAKGLNLGLICLVSLMFWWIWLAHTHFGQVMVFLMAFALWTQVETKVPFKSESKLAVLTFLFTTKIFSLVSLLGVLKSLLKVRVVLYGLLLILGSHLLLLLVYPHASLQEAPALLANLYREWVHAASSGGVELGAEIVRGQQNHGFVAAILRKFDADATHVNLDVLVAGALALGFSFLWAHFSRDLRSEEKWSGWLTIGVIAHPLAWHHSFTLVFPLCAFSLQRAVQSRRRGLIFLSVFGIACIGLLIPQVIGVDAVVPLENWGNKSWGTLASAIALVLSARHHLSNQDPWSILN